MAKKKPLIDKMSGRLQKTAATVSAIVVLLGAVGGFYSWTSQQFANAVSGQIQEFREETKKTTNQMLQTITRLELLSLMEYDPDNIVAIEKIARYYFVTLEGNTWASRVYSKYAKEHGIDASFVLGGAE